MRKGERTREHIIERAAGLFNRRGFSGAALSDIMRATGLQKGGIYRHFESKEALALEAFDFAVARMRRRCAEALDGKVGAVDRLLAIVGVFTEMLERPPVPGGCPLMNTAVDSDDGNPLLRSRARAAMDELRGLVRRVTEAGRARGELRPEVDAEALATVLVGTLEGGLMLARLYDDPAHLERAAAHVTRYLEREVRAV